MQSGDCAPGYKLSAVKFLYRLSLLRFFKCTYKNRNKAIYVRERVVQYATLT